MSGVGAACLRKGVLLIPGFDSYRHRAVCQFTMSNRQPILCRSFKVVRIARSAKRASKPSRRIQALPPATRRSSEGWIPLYSLFRTRKRDFARLTRASRISSSSQRAYQEEQGSSGFRRYAVGRRLVDWSSIDLGGSSASSKVLRAEPNHHSRRRRQ